MKKIKNIITILSILSLVVFITSEAIAENRILNIRHWVAPDHTRIVVDTTETPDYSVEKNKEFVRIDFKNTVYPVNIPKQSNLNKPGVKMIAVMSEAQQIIRVEITLADHVDTNVFKLSKIEDKPDRVVVDIELPDVVQKEKKEREQVKITRKDRIIIIDPGHGGDDPGAIGRSGAQEKDVVLKIAKKLKENLNRRKGYHAFLTRDGDYYVPFSKRLKIAREYGADLLLSVHADAAHNQNASGTSVYCLSTGGATTEAAKLLANKENLADVMGGSPNGENSDASDPIVLNMYQTNTINTSKTYGMNMLKHMGQIIPVKFATIQEAPLRVLKLPEIPSILVETAYISNKKEEKLLISDNYQKRIAETMAEAVAEFLPPVEPHRKGEPAITVVKQDPVTVPSTSVPEPVEASAKAAAPDKKQPPQNATTQFYLVKKGDSIEKIAIKQDMNVADLLKLNNMKLNDKLYFGRKIKIVVVDKKLQETPSSQEPIKPSKQLKTGETSSESSTRADVSVYKVKEGDTLEKIARKHDTTLGALLQINNIKMKDPLVSGRMIKLKETPPAVESKVTPNEKVSKGLKKPKFVYYKVKKGETLDIIARRNGISISQLRQLNHMRPSDRLLAHQRLKLPSQSSL